MKTRSKTIQSFVSIYSGPTFELHWKYAYIINVVIVTLLYGPALPILFPICLASLISLYVTERLMIAYCYQRPPMTDTTICREAINLLHLAPLYYMVAACWVYSNQQVYMNRVVVNHGDYFYASTKHYAHQLFT